MKKAIVSIFGFIIALGLANGLMAQGPQIDSQCIQPYGFEGNFQDSYINTDPLVMLFQLLASPFASGLSTPGMTFPFTGLSGFPRPMAFPPYGGYGYPLGIIHPEMELFSAANLSASPFGFGSLGTFFPYYGFKAFPDPGIVPLHGYSPLTAIASPGFCEVGTLSSGIPGQEFRVIMPPGIDKNFTMADVMYQGRLGIPIPGNIMSINVSEEDKYTCRLFLDAYTGTVYPVWNEPWWNTSSGQVNTLENW